MLGSYDAPNLERSTFIGGLATALVGGIAIGGTTVPLDTSTYEEPP
jgi:hypothetical protein